MLLDFSIQSVSKYTGHYSTLETVQRRYQLGDPPRRAKKDRYTLEDDPMDPQNTIFQGARTSGSMLVFGSVSFPISSSQNETSVDSSCADHT